MSPRDRRWLGSSGRRLSVAERYYERGLDYFAKKRFDLAIADLDEALLHEPQNAEYYVARGLALLQKELASEAEEDFALGLELDPTQWLAHYGRGLQAIESEQYTAAVNFFSRAQRVAPERPEIYFCRAVAFFHTGNSDEAVRDMQFAQKLMSPDDKRRDQADKWLAIFSGD